MSRVKVVGAGLSGVETANYLANHGIKVDLYDIKPHSFTPAHKSEKFAELVCSNSLKSGDTFGNAAGLLKEEMRILKSLVISSADKTKVPAGNALAVDREKFSEYITNEIRSNKNITFHSEEVNKIDFDEYTVIATGPLTTDALSKEIEKVVGGRLSFFDASAPIISFDSIDMNSAFIGDRYGKGTGDHVNCPLNKEEYYAFIDQLLNAERVKLESFENSAVFEGCMPVEVMASRGKDTLRFGPLKAAGLTDPKTGRWPYACLQLRKEDENGTMYNMVGFQTNLKFPEQKRVFGMIPALKNAEFLRYGVMHRNTFINSPKCLSVDLSLKESGKTFFAGQITGVEGYIESAACGILAGIYCERKLNGKSPVILSDKTVLGALIKYVSTVNPDFEPMNSNFGILPPPEIIIKDKKEKKEYLAKRSLSEMKNFVKEIEL